MIEHPRRVVLLIDYDNLQICASRDTPGRDLQLTPVVQLAQRYGTVILARAYAEWNLSTERLAVYKAGIEPAFAPVLRTESDRSGKSLADTVMVAEGMDMLWTLSPDVVVLATSDKDLIPLVRVAKQRGAFVVVLGSDFTAIPLREMADEHVTYRQLITDASGRFATEAGPARQPAALPEPSRRRSRERNGRDRTTPTSTAVAPSIPARPDRGDRQEREAAAPAPAAATAPAAAPAEPVAPIAPATSGDVDSQAGGRRRRRRGSRRRSERVGVIGESGGSESAAGEGEGEFEGEERDEEQLEITPTTSIADVAQASGGTIEVPPGAEAAEAGEPGEMSARVESAPRAPTEAADTAAPAPRDRRRRTRRPAGAAAAGSPTEESAGASVTSPSDEPPAAPTLNDLPSAGEAAGPIESQASTNGEEPTEPAPRARPRRVASAARGRSRAPR